MKISSSRNSLVKRSWYISDKITLQLFPDQIRHEKISCKVDNFIKTNVILL